MPNFTTACFLMKPTKSELKKFSLSPLFHQIIGCSVFFKHYSANRKQQHVLTIDFQSHWPQWGQDFPPVFYLKGQHRLKPEHPQCFHCFWRTDLFLPQSQLAMFHCTHHPTVGRGGTHMDRHLHKRPKKKSLLRKHHLYFPFICAP